MSKKFLRTHTKRLKRLGKNSKKKQRWRKPRGRDNKVREKKKSKGRKVEIGYRGNKKDRGKIMGKEVVFIRNIEDAERLKKDSAVIISKMGRKKRQEIEKKIKEKGADILNLKKITIKASQRREKIKNEPKK